MTSRLLYGATVVLSVTTALLGAQALNRSNGRVHPSDDDIRQVLRQRVDAQGKGIGIVVGVIDASESVKEISARSMAIPLSR